MNNIAAKSILWGYRWLGAAAYPFIGVYLKWRLAKGKEEEKCLRERYGFAGKPRPDGPLIWIHAASIGEASAMAALAERIIEYGIGVVLTTGTVTSAQIIRERLKEKVIHQYVPLDLKPAVGRFLDHWKPDLVIIAESEIWPVTILELGARRISQILVNGRISDKSFALWSRYSSFARTLFENIAQVIAQSELDGYKFLKLGARPVMVGGNLKINATPPAINPKDLKAMKFHIKNRKTWAAISTHGGEEMIAMEVHRTLKQFHKNLLTIIVPRHIKRCNMLEKKMVDMGLKVARYSRRDVVLPDTDVLLGDTMGDIGLYLRLTEIAFMGKSLLGEGGQNPLEAAMLGTAILSGKNVQNFRDIYKALI